MRARILMVFLGFSYLTYGQIGTIDPLQVLASLPGYAPLMDAYAKKSKQMLDSQQVYITRYSTCLERSYALDSASIHSLDDSIQFYQDKMVAYQQYSERKMKQLDVEMKQSLDQELRVQIKAYCEKNKLQGLFDQKGTLYCPSCKDHTEAFKKFLKNGN